MHPLVEATRRSTVAEDERAWAQAAADRLEPLLAAAGALIDATPTAAAFLRGVRQQLDLETPRYLGLAPAQAWYEAQARALHAKAVALFGETAALEIAPALHYTPLPARPAGPRSPFGW